MPGGGFSYSGVDQETAERIFQSFFGGGGPFGGGRGGMRPGAGGMFGGRGGGGGGMKQGMGMFGGPGGGMGFSSMFGEGDDMGFGGGGFGSPGGGLGKRGAPSQGPALVEVALNLRLEVRRVWCQPGCQGARARVICVLFNNWLLFNDVNGYDQNLGRCMFHSDAVH